MARTDAGAQLTQAHRRQQLQVRAAAVDDLAQLWPVWRPDDVNTFDSFAAGATTLVRSYNRDSARLAADYYRGFRRVEGASGAVSLQLAEPPAVEAVTTSLRATGLAGTYTALQAGRDLSQAREVAFVRVAGAAGRHVLNGGRQTVMGTVESDGRARGWRRVTSASPCPFCSMLAGRGPVYSESTVGFQAHDHCACSSEPVFA